MSTAEKLLVEIFHRKNSITEQAIQQTHLFIQNLASELVIEGITPPPWAWTASHSADPKELNKEELISRLLRRQDQPSACCSRAYYPSYSNPVGTGNNNVEISDDFVMDPLIFKKAKNHPKVSTISKGDVGCSFKNNQSEMDVSIISPEDQKDERVIDIYKASDKPATSFQRSKSRQKALQLRRSRKSLIKSGTSHENINENFRLSISSTKHVGGENEIDPLVSTEVGQGCMEQDCGNTDSVIKEKDTGICTGSVTRSRSCAKGPKSVEGSRGLGYMSSSCGNDVVLSCAKVGAKRSMSDCNADQADYINKLQKSGPSPVSFRRGIRSYGREDHQDRDIENGITKNNNRSGVFCGRASDSLEAACSSDNDHRMLARDNVTTHCAHDSVASYSQINVLDEIVDDHQSIAQFCQNENEKGIAPYIRMAGSLSLSEPNACADNTPQNEDISSHSNRTDGCNLPTSSGTLALHVNAPSEEQKFVESSFGTDHIVTRPLSWANQDIPNSFSRPQISTSKLEKKYAASDEDLNDSGRQSIPPCYTVHHNDQQDADTVVGTEYVLCKVDQSVNTGPIDNKQSGVPESSVGIDSSHFNVQEILEASTEKYAATELNMSKISQNDAEVCMNCEISEVQDEINVKQSEADEPPCLHNPPVKLHVDLTPISLPWKHNKEGNWEAEEKDDVSPVSNDSRSNTCKRPYSANLFHKPSADSQDNFFEKEERGLPACDIHCEVKQIHTEDYQALPCLDFDISGQNAESPVGENGLMIANSDGSAVLKSWPQVKKRKIEHKEANRHTTSPRFRMEKLQIIEGGLSSTYLMNMENDLDFPDAVRVTRNTDMEMNQFVDLNQTELESTSEYQNGRGDRKGEENDEVSPVSNASRSNAWKRFEEERENPACDIHCEVKRIQTEDDQALPCLDSDLSGQNAGSSVGESGLMIANSGGSAVLNSWPQLKKRNIEHQEASRHTTSPRFRMKKRQIIQGGPSSTYLMNMEKDLDFPNAFRETRNTDMEMNQLVDLNLTELESTSEYQNGGGDRKGEENDEVSPVSNASRSNSCKRFEEERASPACDIHCEVRHLHTEEDQALPCLDSDISGRNAGSPVVLKSWPQPKKRNIEHQEANRHTTSPRFRMKKLQIIERGPSSTYIMEKDLDFPDSFRVTRNTDMEMNQLVDVNLTELESTSEYQNGGDRFCSKEQNKGGSSPSIIEQSGTALVDSLTQEKAGKSEGLYVQGIRNYPSIVHLVSGDLDKNILGDTDYENSIVNRMDENPVSSQWKGGLHSLCSVLSPNNPVDQPVFEGFRVDGQSDSGELEFPAEEVDFDLLNFPRSTIERASTLVNLCELAITDRPLSEFKDIQNLSRSVPNNLLKSLGMRSDLPLKGDVDKQLVFGRSGLDNVKVSSEQIPYSDCLPRYDALYRWNSGNLLASPVGRFSERLSLEKRSSEKCSSTSSDHTCFRIEEDPCVSEGSGTMDGAADDVQDGTDSPLCNSSNKRKPLGERTNLGPVPSVSGFTQDDICRESSAVSVTASQYKFQRSVIEKPTSSLGKQTFSVGVNGTKKTKQSVNGSVNRSGLRSKSNLKRQENTHSLKRPRQKNIVSNVNSFLPLVQQKAAATMCAGKRDVKVKALEIAEAAKRLEERRENERKMKREALKLERVKLEEKNLRQKELEKKRKEDERKKKDADNILKKRLREEEEMKEEKKKKMRIEARQRQREQEEISHAKKAVKDNDHSKGEKVKSKKERNETKKPQNKETMRDDSVLKKTESKWVPAQFENDHEVLGTSGDILEAEKAMHTMDKSPASALLMFQKSQGKSYEISPYQCSDDDEDEEELSPKKFIPSWASKSSVVVRLAMQQEVKTDEVFPPGSFCSMDRVLLPRSVQKKTHA